MTDPLEGCRAKVERAKEHFYALYGEYGAFFERNPFGFANYTNPAAGEQVYLARISRQPPTARWGVIAGEIVHQLRSALDLLVWQLVLDNGGRPKTGAGGTGFPICRTEDGYEKSSRTKLRGASETAVKAIENIQPYRMPEGMGYLLGVLHDLDIRDKHQVLNLAVGTFRGGVVTYAAPAETVDMQQYVAEAHEPFAPIEDGAVLLRHPIGEEGPGASASGHFNFGVAFEQGGPAPGKPLITTLNVLVQAVEQLITMLRSLFRGHPLYHDTPSSESDP